MCSRKSIYGLKIRLKMKSGLPRYGAQISVFFSLYDWMCRVMALDELPPLWNKNNIDKDN